MLVYRWTTEKNDSNIINNIENAQVKLRDGDNLFIKKFFIFMIICYVSAREVDFVSSRGTIHYTRHITFLINRLKYTSEQIYVTGVALFDILERLFIIGLVLVGGYNAFEHVIAGIILSILVYILIIIISGTKDLKTLNFLKSTLLQ